MNNIQKIANTCLKCQNARCQTACPIQMPIPKILSYLEQGLEEEAWQEIMKTTNMGFLCGYLCDHGRGCASGCLKGLKGEPVLFYLVEQALSDHYYQDYFQNLPTNTGYRVAIIGGGVCGISAAMSLIKAGIYPTIFEKTDHLGGVVTTSLPSFRYDKTIFNKVIETLLASGVTVKYEMTYGNNLLNQDLKDFDEIIMTYGSEINRTVLPKNLVYQGLELLRDSQKGLSIKNQNILVLGGGNVACDVARTLKRMGNHVTIVYRRDLANSPASHLELQLAKTDGVMFQECLSPVEVITNQNAQVEGLKVEVMHLYNDGSSRLNFAKTGEFQTIPCTMIVEALGSKVDYQYLKASYPKLFNESGYPVANEDLTTIYPHLYIGGDAYTGPASFAKAMLAGKKIAQAIIKKHQ